MPVWEKIVTRFQEEKVELVVIPNLAGGVFQAQLRLGTEEIWVSNLGNSPLLGRNIFETTVSFLRSSGGTTCRGNARGARLGDPGLEINTVEGHVALHCFNYQAGQWVFSRITPITGILLWANVCSAGRGTLSLHPDRQRA